MPKDRIGYEMRYRNSRRLLERACRVIPSGSQTFSKSSRQYPAGLAPHFVLRGRGSRVWDVDGNEYVDFINSLGAVNLGHGDRDVVSAVEEQIRDGVIFSLPHPIEMRVAEKIQELVPCAEMTRFGKNGADATSAAIRLARAYTGRDHVLTSGYHGWHDWYVGCTTMSRGVPQAVRDLTHTFTYNSIESVHQLFGAYPDKIAAVILEPMNMEEPKPGFLEELKSLAHHYGALLVFDEVLTGFRFATGGAQSLFGVEPDLATFAKALANGYPLSAVSGRGEIMRLMEEVFFSITYGGETFSLAAALATMTKLQNDPVIDTLYDQGTKVIQGVQTLITKHDVAHFVTVSGNPTLSFLTFNDVQEYSQWEVKTLFLQEILSRGILTFGIHIMSYAHSDAEVSHLLGAYDEVFALLKAAVDGSEMQHLLLTEPLKPIFKLR
jgi:glutamate-1-semialdehyde 2,1-aminomutase